MIPDFVLHPPTRYAIDADGRFTRDGKSFVPVGVNYWPASCGVEMWQVWPEEEIRHDLDVIGSLGLNSLRFFLRWPDFQLQPDHLDAAMLDKLRAFMGWCAERDLAAMPTLYVGFMSGGFFWPEWKQANLYSPELREPCRFYNSQIAAVLAPFSDTLLGIDQGNELNCIPDSREAGPQWVGEWSGEFADAVRAELGGIPIMSGLDHQACCNELGWQLDNQVGCDCLSVHGYPVSPWWPVPFDGLTDPFCQNLLPLCTRINRAFGPAMLQEFGSIATHGRSQQESYLRGMLEGTRSAGANGWLWWCLRDIRADVHPYIKTGMERSLGLVDATDAVKPGLELFLNFAREVQNGLPDSEPLSETGLYWPRHPYAQNDPGNPGNTARDVFRGIAVADFGLRQDSRTTRIVRGDLPVPEGLKTLIVCGATLDQMEARDLGVWVRSGGHLILLGIDSSELGPDFTNLIGAVPVDYRKPIAARFDLGGGTWTFASFKNGIRVELAPRSASVQASDPTGVPMILENHLGRGRTTTVVPLIHDTFLAEENPGPACMDFLRLLFKS